MNNSNSSESNPLINPDNSALADLVDNSIEVDDPMEVDNPIQGNNPDNVTLPGVSEMLLNNPTLADNPTSLDNSVYEGVILAIAETVRILPSTALTFPDAATRSEPVLSSNPVHPGPSDVPLSIG